MGKILPGLDKEQHQELSSALRTQNTIFNRYKHLFATAYGVSDKSVAKITQLLTNNDELRSILDNKVAKDLPHLSSQELTQIYYPLRENS